MEDFSENPAIVIWETTRACALKCVHCRAEAIDRRDPDELTMLEAFDLLKEIRHFGKPLVVLTGGDPLRRDDIGDLIEYGTCLGLHVAMTPSATDKATQEVLEDLKEKGLARLAVSLDGSTPEIHDAFRQVDGSFRRTIDIMRWAGELEIPLQINTTVGRYNYRDMARIAALLEGFGVSLWSVFFMVPMGRAKLEDGIGASEFEKIFHWMADLEKTSPFQIKSTEAPQYRRVLLQKRRNAEVVGDPISEGSFTWAHACRSSAPPRPIKAVNDGKGFVFVSHTGEIYPSGFLPLSAGNVKKDSLVDVYRHSTLFRRLRDSSLLKGKCGACEYKSICGGSRSRAFSVYGDVLAEDPFCIHVPKGYQVKKG